MGVIDRIFAGSDPSRDWVADPLVPLEFDFSLHALCGVRVGNPFSLLSILGPAEDRKAAGKGLLRYFSRGVEVEVGEGRVRSIRLVWVDEFEEGFNPFPGACRLNGQTIPLGAGTREEEVLALFGEPWWHDEDEDEVILFYEFSHIEWEIELRREGTLKSILVLTPPLLADEAQRKAYGVTRAWPP
ncbi:MAG: hypothetical protein HYY93_09505 [Planctomycetes bacterium]|nr:hypothetical protein [Planctomycetota bacterium]